MPLADARPVAMIATADRKAAEPFYADTLGLPRKGDDGFAALFDLAGITLRLTEVPGYAAPFTPVLGLEVPDIEAAVAALAAKGVTMNVYEGLGQDEQGIWTAPDGSCKVAFFSDPDGNGLSLTRTTSLDGSPLEYRMSGGTTVTVSASDVPRGISAEVHEAGLASSLDNLARFAAQRG